MSRRFVVGMTIVFLLLTSQIPTARAEYASAIVTPDCLAVGVVLNAELGKNQTLPSEYNGKRIPIIRQTFKGGSLFTGGFSPFVLGIIATDDADGRIGGANALNLMANNFWSAGTTDPRWEMWVSGRLSMGTATPVNNLSVTVEFNFENLTTTVSGSAVGSLDSIVWHDTSFTLAESGTQYAYFYDFWNTTGELEMNPRVGTFTEEIPCTGGNTYGGRGGAPTQRREIIHTDYTVYYKGAPSAPVVTATPGNGNVLLTWSAVPGAISYFVCRDTTSHPFATDCALYPFNEDVGNVVSYVDVALTNGVTYFYRVRSWDGSAGTVSDEVDATPQNNAPTLSGRSWRENAELRWTDGTLTDITDFYLYRGNSTANLSQLLTFDGIIHSYDDPQQPGECWYYAVRSANATELSGLSNILLLCYKPSPPPLFGDHGSIWGGSVDENGNPIGGRAELAEQTGFSYISIGIFYGLFLTTALGFSGYQIGAWISRDSHWFGTLVGCIAGIALSLIFGFFPLWAVAFVGTTGTAIFLLFRIRKGGE